MRVAAYIRVSTDEQADKGNSLSEQKERLTAYCVAMGWNLPYFFIDDGYSAKNLKRPGIKDLIESVERNEHDILLTAKLDRLCRNLLDLLQLIELLEQYNCSFVSASESFDTSTAVGRMTLQLLGTFAEFERERTSERVTDNMLSLAKNSSKALTRPCYGYDVVDGHYQINEAESEVILLMFSLAEESYGPRMIAKILNDKNITTKKGAPWDQVNVKRLMDTETLTGTMVYNKRKSIKGKTVFRDKSEWIVKEDNHPAIIPIDRFLKVQEIIKSRSRAHKHADNESYLLTGLIKCKYCGGNMKGNTSRLKRSNKTYTYHKYICSSYVLGYGCRHHAVHRDDLENKIIEHINNVASASDINFKIKVAPARTIDDEVKELKMQLSRVSKKMQKQIEAYEKDLISDDDLREARERVDAERKKLNQQLEKISTRGGNAEDVKKNASRLINDIAGIDRLKAKNALRELIDRIEVEGELISITWIG